jgi:putative aldouronate transport system substrate-binding protein
MKKIVSILMVLVLVLSVFVGCTKKAETTTETATETTESTTTKEPVTAEKLSFKVMTVNFGEAPTDKAVQKAWLAECERLMGRELDITFEYVNNADYAEKLRIMLASGDLPDIFTLTGLSQEDIFSYGQNGVFLDLTANMDKLPNYQKYLDSAKDSLGGLYSTEGILYAFYNIQYGWQGYSGGSNEIASTAAFRKDILDANNIAIPQTVEEVYTAATKLKAAYPDKYPIMLMEEWQQPVNMLFNANHVGETRYYDGSKYAYGPLQQGYKDALVEMNRWYSEGLISPDYFVQTQANGNATIAAGDGMIIPSNWYGYPGYWATLYPDQDWVVVPGIKNATYGEPWVFSQGSMDDTRILPWWSIAINPSSKNVDELLKFMDIQMSDSINTLLSWGIEGETYTIVDGTKQFTEAVLADKESSNKYGYGSGSSRSGIFPQTQDMMIELAKAYDQNYVFNGQEITETIPGFVKGYFSITQAIPDTTINLSPLTPEESETYASIMTPIDTYAKEQMAAFISGGRSFDEWDQYIEELAAMGDIQKALDIYQSHITGTK